jgi:hypothetical protein
VKSQRGWRPLERAWGKAAITNERVFTSVRVQFARHIPNDVVTISPDQSFIECDLVQNYGDRGWWVELGNCERIAADSLATTRKKQRRRNKAGDNRRTCVARAGVGCDDDNDDDAACLLA